MSAKLSEQLAIVGAINPQLVDNNTVSSGQIDMRKRRKAMFLISVGATDIGVNAKIREAKDSGGTSEQDLSGKAITALTATDDNKQCIIEVDASELSDLYTHLSCDIVVADGTTGAYVSMIALADAEYNPASADDATTVAQIVA